MYRDLINDQGVGVTVMVGMPMGEMTTSIVFGNMDSTTTFEISTSTLGVI
jgi:hypothetical protein